MGRVEQERRLTLQQQALFQTGAFGPQTASRLMRTPPEIGGDRYRT